MLSILKMALAILLSTTVIANAWEEIPKIHKKNPILNQNAKNPCTSMGTIKNLKSLTYYLAMKKWIALSSESQDAREIAEETSQYLSQSIMMPFHIRHYLPISSINIAFCSAVLTINGKPLVLTGEQGRNHIRFMIKHDKGVFKEIAIIDYDVAIFDLRYNPNPSRSDS